MSARRDRFGLRDVVAEATSGVGARPVRLLLTVLGTVLGIASVVVTIGLAQTAANRVNERFDAVAATQATAEPATRSTWSGRQQAIGSLPWDAPERAQRLAGVEAAATVSPVDLGGATVSTVAVHDPSAPALAPPPVVATSPGLLDAVGGHLREGRFFDAGHDARGDRVVVLGADAAARLGVTRVATQPSVFIGDVAYQVVGLLDRVERRPDLLGALVVPQGTAAADLGLVSPAALQLRIAVGAGATVAEQLPIALAPDAPDRVDVSVPPPPAAVQDEVRADLNVVFLALGGVALLIGGVGIANVTLLSVMERAGEIGLRRALGARRRDVAAQFVAESVLVGALGGLIGAALGVGVVAVVSLTQEWTPILDLRVVAAAAAVGALVGLLAGGYPAAKAARLEPVAALRSGL
ncbi:ABC transporter permease [Cellulomonas marina]|uniref:Putative ABC transport system permease protein n=1 Tax=Cellulomonas marina TaxID=988821 RepID=A0A1I0Y2T4_9CELL|nr:ABC transporter permease [Cellulomonas marina]GIG29754.1 ABC transporter permease [Cellulomonas marina]SFB07444.1 putative ABC transport system permease protein [Cellulomonas marina]